MSDKHPETLPWYVAGTLDPERTEQVRAHLESCEECRREAAALIATREALADTGHLPPDLLADYADGLEKIARRKNREIERHLSACAACRRDLAELGGGGEFAHGTRKTVLRLLAATLLIAVSAFVGRELLPRRAVLQPLDVVTLAPASRSPVSIPTLVRPGPWALRVLPPSTATDEEFELVVIGRDDSVLHRLPRVPWTDRVQGVTLLFPDLEPGAYRILLRSVDRPEDLVEYSLTITGESP